jgi:Methyltransferase domain
VLEQAAVEAFAERVLGDYAGANAFFMAGIGDRLGLFKELAANGAATSDELATRTRLQERYVREWLAGMAAAGYLDYDPATGRYALPADHVPVLAEEAGPFFFGSAFFDFSTNFGETYRRLVDAFRDGGGVPQSEYGAEVAESIERFTAPWFEHMLVQQWLPLMPDTLAKLEEGAIVCDVGCGRGRALSKLAAAFPRSRFIGYDVYEPAIQAARARVQDAGVADRVRLEVRDAAQGFGERFDVVTTFDVLHDSVDPGGILSAIRSTLSSNRRLAASRSPWPRSTAPEQNEAVVVLLLTPVEGSRRSARTRGRFCPVIAEATMLVLPVPVPPASSWQAARSPEG